GRGEAEGAHAGLGDGVAGAEDAGARAVDQCRAGAAGNADGPATRADVDGAVDGEESVSVDGVGVLERAVVERDVPRARAGCANGKGGGDGEHSAAGDSDGATDRVAGIGEEQRSAGHVV